MLLTDVDSIEPCLLRISQEDESIGRDMCEDDIVKCIPIVRSIAWSMKRKMYVRMDIDDLISIGMCGLMEASKRYSEDGGGSFKNYAIYRIAGSMLDEIKKRWFEDLSSDGMVEGVYAGDDAEGVLIKKIEQMNVVAAIRSLSSQQARVIYMYYYQGLLYRQIASKLKVSESRVCHIRTEAILKLRRVLGVRIHGTDIGRILV